MAPCLQAHGHRRAARRQSRRTRCGQDKPQGELRIALAFLGAQRLIPWAEVPSGGIKQHQILLYDYLVGCTDDGQLALRPEESTRMAQLRTSEADIVAVSREKVPEVKAAGYNIFSKLNDQVIVVYMQQQWDQVPVAEKRVRQALNLALDKEAILKFVFAGQGVPVPMYPIGSYGVAGGADATLQALSLRSAEGETAPD